MNITWKVLSKDVGTNSMVVEYGGDVSIALNIPIPTVDKDIDEWVKMYLPQHHVVQQEFHDVAEGAEGSFTVELVAPVQSEQANMVGSWNEEYLRAMIYQVIEEIREAEA